MRPDPAGRRQFVGHARPAFPLVVERDAGVHHRAPLRQKDVVYGPVEAAGAAQPGHVPAAGHELGLLALENPAPVERPAFGAGARLAVVENLEAGEHPLAFLAAAAEAPAPGDAITAIDLDRLPAALHGSAGEHRVTLMTVNLLDPVIRQTERDQLADAVIGEVPADRATALGEQLDHPRIGDRINLQPTQRARDHHAIAAGLAQLFDERFWQAL